MLYNLLKKSGSLFKRALMLCAVLATFTNLFAYDFEVDGIYYNQLGNAEAEVTRNYDHPYSGSVVIPEKVTYGGVEYSVTSIGENAFYCSSLTSVTIGNSVTSIGEKAFYCTSLTSVTIPDSVTTIGLQAFDGCSFMSSVTIGSSVSSIGERAFENCNSLSFINFNSNNQSYASEDGVLFNKDFTKLILFPYGNP